MAWLPARNAIAEPRQLNAVSPQPRCPLFATRRRLRQHGAMQGDLRLATTKDLRAVEEIVRAAYSPYISLIGREPGPMSDDYRKSIADGHVHVVEQEGVVSGFLVLIPERDVMLLDNVAVAPFAQGLGLGRKMLEFAERAARDAGFSAIRLYTNVAMTENI